METARQLLPGHIRRFIWHVTPFLDIAVDRDLDDVFVLRLRKPESLDALWSVLERYSTRLRDRLTICRAMACPDGAAEGTGIFLRPGEPAFDRFTDVFTDRYGLQALRDSNFVDPTSEDAYLFYLILVEIVRGADPTISGLEREELLQAELVGLRQSISGAVTRVHVEHLLLLRGGSGLYGDYVNFAAQIVALREQATTGAHEIIAEL